RVREPARRPAGAGRRERRHRPPEGKRPGADGDGWPTGRRRPLRGRRPRRAGPPGCPPSPPAPRAIGARSKGYRRSAIWPPRPTAPADVGFATRLLAYCDMRTLYLRNVPDVVVERLERLANREAMSVSAVAVRELADVSRRADNAALLGALPDLGVDTAEVITELD